MAVCFRDDNRRGRLGVGLLLCCAFRFIDFLFSLLCVSVKLDLKKNYLSFFFGGEEEDDEDNDDEGKEEEEKEEGYGKEESEKEK